MSDWLREWGSFTATFVLVGPTAWHAYLTRVLAKCAQESARSAREVAEASRLSVSAALAGVDVGFAVSPVYGVDEDEGQLVSDRGAGNGSGGNSLCTHATS